MGGTHTTTAALTPPVRFLNPPPCFSWVPVWSDWGLSGKDLRRLRSTRKTGAISNGRVSSCDSAIFALCAGDEFHHRVTEGAEKRKQGTHEKPAAKRGLALSVRLSVQEFCPQPLLDLTMPHVCGERYRFSVK